MGLIDSMRIQSELLEGLPAETPLAIVQNATLPDQRQAVTTLGNMRQTIALEKLCSPAVIVIGDVVSGIHAANQLGTKVARGA